MKRKKRTFAELGKEAKSEQVSFRITKKQRERLEELSYDNGMTIVEYAIKRLKL